MNGLFSIDPVAGLVMVVGAYTALVMWLANVQSVAQAARDGVAEIKESRKADKLAYDARLERAEESASAIVELRASMANLGDMMEREAKHQAERHQDLKAEIQHVRNGAAMLRDAALRRSPKGRSDDA